MITTIKKNIAVYSIALAFLIGVPIANAQVSGGVFFPPSTGGGGGGTPGGTNGQIQYNNAGSFGGVTAVPISKGGTNATTNSGAANAVGIQLIPDVGQGAANYLSASPAYEGQMGVNVFGTYPSLVYFSGAGTFGQSIGIPGGLESTGDQTHMDAATDPYFTVNVCGDLVRNCKSGDSGIRVTNWATSTLNSGASLFLVPLDENQSVHNRDAVSYNLVPPNRVSGIIPGNVQLVNSWDATYVRGLAVSGVGIPTAPDGGNFSIQYNDYTNHLFRIPFWEHYVYQPSDVSYTFTVSGITTPPSLQDQYFSNGARLTIEATSLSGTAGSISGTITATATSTPSASGNLTKLTGNDEVGDATIAFSGYTVAASWQDSLTSDPNSGITTLRELSLVKNHPVLYNGVNLIVASTSLFQYFIGNSANSTATGGDVISIGDSALHSITSGAENYAIGKNAGYNLLTGAGNFAMGGYSLYSATDDSASTVAIGVGAMQNVNHSYRNVAIGAGSADSGGGTINDMVAVGYNVFPNVTGITNTGIGSSAGNILTSGTGNILIGPGAGSYTNGITTASDVVMIGGGTAFSDGNQYDKSIAIGQNALIGGANVAIIGGTGADAVRLANGTSSPVANFQTTNGNANATTTAEIGKAGQNKGSCLKLYRSDGSAIYAYVAASATTFTLTTTACATVTGF